MEDTDDSKTGKVDPCDEESKTMTDSETLKKVVEVLSEKQEKTDEEPSAIIEKVTFYLEEKPVITNDKRKQHTTEI